MKYWYIPVIGVLVFGYFYHLKQSNDKDAVKQKQQYEIKKIESKAFYDKGPTVISKSSISEFEEVKVIGIPEKIGDYYIDNYLTKCIVYTNNKTNTSNMRCNNDYAVSSQEMDRLESENTDERLPYRYE